MPLKRISVVLTNHQSYDAIRVVRPLEWPGMKQALWQAGIATDMMSQNNISLQALAGTDCVVFHGVANPNTMNLLRKLPCPFAMFQDDLMKELPPWNPNKISPVQVKVLDWMLDHAAAIVATTQPLAEALGHIEKTIVMGNLEDFKPLPAPLPGRERRALYAGGNSHAADLELLNDLDWAGDTVIFSHCLPSSKIAAHRDRLGNMSFRPNDPKWGHIPALSDYETYRVWMENLGPRFGIGLAPLVDCRFNVMKSLLKPLEYACRGMVPVVSDVAPYSSLPLDPDISIRVRRGMSWIEAVGGASRLPEIGKRAFEWGYENHSYQKHWRRWVDAYSFIASRI